MSGETDINKLIKGLTPHLNDGEYVFCTTTDVSNIRREDTICEFKEKDGITIVIEKSKADDLELEYEYVASWITLMIHSSLEAVGLTALFSKALAAHGISCNVIAGYYSDHIFVATEDAGMAMKALRDLSKK